MDRRFRLAASVAIPLFGVLLPLTACAGNPFVQTQSCIDWVYFESPSDAIDDATAVARGHVVDRAGSTTYLDLPATTWNVEVDEWLKGSGDAEIVVTSLPRSCGDTGDAMAEAQPEDDVILFLRERPSGWETITPWQGTIPALPDGSIPTSWPEDLYD